MNKLLPKAANNPKGFTLIELMVVITIIAIISVIGMAIYTGIQKRSRDARRTADVDAIAQALETNYNNSTGSYPALSTTFFSSNQVPQDPLSETTKCNASLCRYCSGTSSTDPVAVQLCDVTAPAVANGTPAASSYWMICTNLEVNDAGPGGKDYYCRTSQQ